MIREFAPKKQMESKDYIFRIQAAIVNNFSYDIVKQDVNRFIYHINDIEVTIEYPGGTSIGIFEGNIGSIFKVRHTLEEKTQIEMIESQI